jgi:TP901-1 family phage major tail protein
MSAIKGNDRILFIKQNDTFMPIACLTSNSISENTTMFETTTRASGGWRTSLPDNQSYNLSFSGINQLTGLSVETLQILKRNRVKIIWGIGTVGNITDQGFGYITDINIDDEVNQDSSFSGTIEGYGVPEQALSALGATLDDFLADFNGDLIAD